MLDKTAATRIFIDAQALLEGHFKLTSGRHSNQYMQCAQVLQYPHYTEQLAADLAEKFRNDNIELVVGPAMGGIIVAYEVGRQLKVPAIFTERQDSKMVLRRGFEIKPGQRVLVVEDVVTTGGSVLEVIDIVREQGGNVAGVAVLVDRSGGQVNFGVKQEAVLVMNIQSWEADDCPLCKENKGPAIKPGSRS
ncbi:MAG: orotate phosphoribosyltransferase [Syntrophomonadaceae bacterium]|nr:orotate phosphoribosyltransferase [Syntrophomonadaceae bacterium]